MRKFKQLIKNKHNFLCIFIAHSRGKPKSANKYKSKSKKSLEIAKLHEINLNLSNF